MILFGNNQAMRKRLLLFACVLMAIPLFLAGCGSAVVQGHLNSDPQSAEDALREVVQFNLEFDEMLAAQGKTRRDAWDEMVDGYRAFLLDPAMQERHEEIKETIRQTEIMAENHMRNHAEFINRPDVQEIIRKIKAERQ